MEKDPLRKMPPYLLLDGWRGLTAFWVVAYHSCGPFLGSAAGAPLAAQPLYALAILGKLGVMMFFVVSGYCIAGACYGVLRSGRTIAQYARDRFRRIYPPYLATIALAVAFNLALSLAQSHHLVPPSKHAAPPTTLFSWLTNFTFTQVEFGQPTLVQTFWTLCYEVFFYLLMGLLLWGGISLARRKSAAAGLVPLSAGVGWLTILSVGWLIAAPSSCPFPLTLWYQFGLGAMFFLAGASFPRLPAWQNVFCHPRILFWGVVAIIGAYAVLREMPTANGEILAGHVIVMGQPSTRAQAALILGFVFVLWALRPLDARLARARILRPLLGLGVMSYSLYLAHSIFVPMVDAAGRRLGFDGSRYWITFWMEIAFSLLVGWLFYLAVERHFISSRQKARIESEISRSGGDVPAAAAPAPGL